MKRRKKARKRSPRTVPLTEDLRQILERQLERFRQKFGREPGPGDPVFFDPDADEPRPYDADKVDAAITSAMEKAGADPAKIHAYRRTGMLITEDNFDRWSDEDRAEWQEALEEYEVLRLHRN